MITRTEAAARIREIGVIPVLRADSAVEAQEMAEAIVAGGLPIVEVTMTVPDATALIARLAGTLPAGSLVGAGSVLDVAAARACIDAGAAFVVSPALDLETIACCRERGVAVLPGALTPTEALAAWRSGADFVKIFPCGALGGPSYLRALKAPLPNIACVPTGGVSLASVPDYIAAGAAAVGVGADLADVRALRAGQPQRIREAARAYVDAVRRAR